MKMKYEIPRIKMLKLQMQDSVLLPGGESGTTGEVLAPYFDNYNDSSTWGSIWEDETEWSDDEPRQLHVNDVW